MTPEQAKALRKPFPAPLIGKLPRSTCKQCSGSPGRACSRHPPARCAECGNYMSPAHIHLDYVGHAATWDRVLEVDPAASYRFLARGGDGSPILLTGGFSDPVAKVGLWIELLIADTITPGFGEGKNIKEAISDAIRNAAMRRGVALDLWSKEDLHPDDSGPGEQRQADAAPPKTSSSEPGASLGEASGPGPEALAERLITIAVQLGAEDATREAIGRNRAIGDPAGHIAWLERCIATGEKNLADTDSGTEESPFKAPTGKRGAGG